MAAIIGLNIRKISAEKKKYSGGAVEITTQPAITEVSDIKLPGLGKDISALNIGFKLASSFSPDAGSIIIEGAILYKADNPDAALKEWKKSKALPPADGTMILNHILGKVSIIGLYLSDLLQLPPIVGLPKVEVKPQEKKD